MKFLVVLSAFLAMAIAKPGLYAPIAYTPGVYAPLAYSAIVPGSRFSYSTYQAGPHSSTSSIVQSAPTIHNFIAPITYSAPIAAPIHGYVATHAVAAERSQYHSQDELGQATYGHTDAYQAQHAYQDAAGNKIGSFSYLAPDGRILSTSYIADALGYRVTSNALPIAPEVPAVAHHPENLPVAPQETPAVIEARNAHLAEHEAMKAEHQAAKVDQVKAEEKSEKEEVKSEEGKSRSKRSLLAEVHYNAPLTYTAPLTYATHYTAPAVPLVYSTPYYRNYGYSTAINHGKPTLYYY